ncbi:multicopper oxidase domain-containing protein [Pseudomonas resinovorans]|uniref:Multicopper oxidase domain-containing protein n=1 Tax=Metapseudomonas resinovorans TaxID=53412 RepID=A0ABT4YA77_METRE|nr:multicopper oxidase domain-containing protein [Pseudomonas resinovorans]MDA8485683.1 multicopper oxidase domain-containing protein [Pseudomonas resinovorans]
MNSSCTDRIGAQLTSGKAQVESRRSFLKLSAAAMATPLIARSIPAIAEGGNSGQSSPPTTPWAIELPTEITPIEPTTLDPAPTEAANTAAGEVPRAPHQRFNELGIAETYEMTAMERPDWVFNPAYPPQPVWGFQGNGIVSTPGPVCVGHYGRPMVVRFRNALPQDHQGFGSPEISVHLHNAHTASESDGFPADFFSPNKAGPTLGGPGQFKDHHYGNICAGFDEFQNGIGDLREALGTLFYHDHTMDFTGPNVYKGLMGFYLLFDEIDSGNERDPNPAALRLPSFPYDYPLAFSDKRFDQDGILTWNQVDPDGVLGDKITVNGIIEPFLRVAARKYRFRLLNGGPSRFYQFHLVDASNAEQTFTYIANDGNLLPAPLRNHTQVNLGVAERGDIVVDFSAYPLGTELFLVNRQEQTTTRRPDGVTSPGTRVLKFVVDRQPPEQDLSQVPDTLRELRPLDPAEIAAAPVRRWEFERRNGMWAVNGQFFDPTRTSARVRQGTAEVWELVNDHGGWVHPVHIHFEEGRIISKVVEDVEVPVPPHEQGRKDVYVLGENTILRVFLRFRDFVGKHPIHCHNMIHEDHAMMARWDIELDPSGPSPGTSPAAGPSSSGTPDTGGTP